jgi:phosphatidylglycerophosphate synthase
MFDNHLRSTKEIILQPAARALYSVHPIAITFVALGFGLVAGMLLVQQQYVWALVFWAVNRLLDGLDGTVARITGKQTDLGGYLDILFDFVIYAIIPVTLVIGAPSEAKFLSLAFLLTAFYINSASWMYLSSILEKRKHGANRQGEMTSVTMPGGLIGGTETVIFYTLFIIFPQQAVFLFTLMGALVLFTIGQRFVWATKNLD